jgi:parvulin-like peptidyl-prolyl isomerase
MAFSFARLKIVAIVALLLGRVAPGHAAEPGAMAAQIGPDAISVREVQREMRVALGERKLSPEESEVLQAQTLGLLVNRQLVIHYLEKIKQGATREQIDKHIEQMEARLKRRDRSLEEQLADLGITYTEFRRLLAWEIGWPKYLETKINAANIQKYFDLHRREFDGTKLHVAHVLLKVDATSDPEAADKVIARARQIRDDIAAEKITFAEAAQQHSESPTAEEGGDIGLIMRHEPMPEPFSEAAFELKPGETSEPVVTSFGVHLIHLLGEEPGELTLADGSVEQAVREDLIRYLFIWVSEKQRASSKIVFSGVLPHFSPETGELVPAQK